MARVDLTKPGSDEPPGTIYGARICLYGSQVRDLFGDKLPAVDGKLDLDAAVRISTVGTDPLMVELQVLELASESDVDEDLSPANRVYGKSGPRASED